MLFVTSTDLVTKSLILVIITIGIVLLNNSHSMGNEKIGILIVVVVENK